MVRADIAQYVGYYNIVQLKDVRKYVVGAILKDVKNDHLRSNVDVLNTLDNAIFLRERR